MPIGGTMHEALLKLAKHNNPEARAELVLGICDAIFSNVDKMASQIPVQGRLQLSRRLASHERTPVRLAMKLAEDEVEVARPMLIHGGCFAQEHLLELARRVSEKHLEFIARRHDLSHQVSDKILERGTKAIRRILASNRDIRLSRLALQTLVKQSINDVVLREDLVLRQDLPASLCQRLLPHVDKEAQEKLRGIISGTLSEEKLNQMTRLKLLRREFGPALDTSDMRKLWKFAEGVQIKLDDLAIMLLQDNRLNHVSELMANLTRQQPGEFRNAIYNGAVDKVIETALKLKLRPDTFALLANCRCRQLRIPDKQAPQSGHFPIQRGDADEWVAAYSDALLGVEGFSEGKKSGFAAKRHRRERTRNKVGLGGPAKKAAAI